MTAQGMDSSPGTPGQPQPPYPGLMVRQKITLITKQYSVHSIDENGSVGPLIAFAEQKKMRLREEVQFFADAAVRQLIFSFKSRQILDMAATTDVFDADGRSLGAFRKDAAKSLLNSTWHVEAPGLAGAHRQIGQSAAIGRDTRLGVSGAGVAGVAIDPAPPSGASWMSSTSPQVSSSTPMPSSCGLCATIISNRP